MLILSLQCDTFEYAVKSPTAQAIDLDPGQLDVPNRFENCLFLLVSIDETDGIKQVTRAAKAIVKVVHATGVKQLIINGFAALSGHPADQHRAQEMLRLLGERLAEREPALPVEHMPFGWRKRWIMDVVAGLWAQRSIRT
ncbi:threonyl-tRNA synthetase editing domain-containing protein [Nocardia sp. BMG111209]|uniref:threonyl-tRNA synthetase editing domain-containing protein n=1 Tax=Nocardia sp. BMG111209 TaxID=1160137 RepID=UPI00037206E3|nr:threonyl-tRNA synthetase editing domain-containing protein [Nocardia sp. BMG111209]